jgi:hypothetical protein
MDLRCQYASTHCPNTRSLKISGELHRFCLFHRRSANAAQRRWKQKKLATDTSSEANQQPSMTKTRRRPHSELTARRLRSSRQIAAPRSHLALLQTTPLAPTMPAVVPAAEVEFSIDGEMPLLSDDDMELLSKLLLDVEDSLPEQAFPMSGSDCWWADASCQQHGAVIV